MLFGKWFADKSHDSHTSLHFALYFLSISYFHIQIVLISMFLLLFLLIFMQEMSTKRNNWWPVSHICAKVIRKLGIRVTTLLRRVQEPRGKGSERVGSSWLAGFLLRWSGWVLGWPHVCNLKYTPLHTFYTQQMKIKRAQMTERS